MGLMLDIFNTDAFSLHDMTLAILRQPYQPGLISSLGLFDEDGVSSRLISIEEQDGVLELLPIQTPGGDRNHLGENRRTLRDFRINHVNVEGRIYARQLANVREFGTEATLQTLERVRTRELTKHANSLGVTEEWHRLGAVKGTILDADGSTTLDTFTAFGVTQETEVAFNLAAATEAELHDDIDVILMAMQDNLDGTPLQRVTALCGTDFYKAIVGHSAVKDSYKDWAARTEAMITASTSGQPNDFLRASYIYKAFPYRNIDWVHYRGAVSGQQFVADDKAHFFPRDIPGLFISRYCSSEEFLDTVNTEGVARYSRPMLDPHERWIDLYSEMNDFHICTRPKVLMQGKVGA